MRYRIAFKLGLLLATFSLVAMGIVGYYAYASSRANLLSATQRDLQTATQVLGRNFQAGMDEVSGDARVLARLPMTSAIAGAPRSASAVPDKKRLTDTFVAIMAVHPEYFQIRLIGAAQHGLELVRVDRDGEQLLAVPELDLQEKAHYPYVFNTLKLHRDQVYLSDISINHEQGAHSGLNKPTVRIATPVLASDGEMLGLVVINLDLNRLFERLKSDLPAAYQLYLSNHWGDYLIHPNPAEAFGFDQGRRILIQEFFQPVLALINGSSDSVVTQVEATQPASSGLVAAFVRLPFGGMVDRHFVILGLSQPLENVVSETRRLGWNTVQIILVLGVLAVLLAALVSRAATGHLRRMAEAVTLFSKENVSSELPFDSDDEIGVLARSLNEMQNTIVASMGELIASRHALKHLAQHDSLTGLPNRALFGDRLRQGLALARRDQTLVVLLFVDLDEFKAINDIYGHHVGDLLLMAAAKRMQGCVRNADTVGRLGGDEFVVLLANVDAAQDALGVAEKIREALSQPFDLDGRQLAISASIGVALYPEHGSDEVALSKSADAAMYCAKSSGGNRVRLLAAASDVAPSDR
jgi:diguanylate cyclase (GGDEF)-like protein